MAAPLFILAVNFRSGFFEFSLWVDAVFFPADFDLAPARFKERPFSDSLFAADICRTALSLFTTLTKPINYIFKHCNARKASMK